MSDQAMQKQTGSDPAFNCTMCGWCCEGSGGIVVSLKDRDRLCAHLGLSPEAFEREWCERRGGKLQIRAGENGACVFFGKGSGCSVHVAKPDICRAWPFFRGNLVDADSYALAKDFCPGLVKEQVHELFARQGLACLVRDKLVGTGASDEAGALQVADLLENLAQNSGKL